MRLFAGIPVPPSDAYAQLTQRLVAAHPDARPVPAGSWHVTLRFLGEVEDPGPVVAALAQAVEGHAAMACRVADVGGFPSRERARVVWVGVHADGLRELEAAVRGATALYGEPPDKRPFHAHATLARCRVPVDLRMDGDGLRDGHFADGELDRLVLWESRLGPEGPTYVERAVLPLAPAA